MSSSILKYIVKKKKLQMLNRFKNKKKIKAVILRQQAILLLISAPSIYEITCKTISFLFYL